MELVDKNATSCVQQWEKLEYCNGQITKGFHGFLSRSSNYAYELFSQSTFTGADLSSKVSELLTYISKSDYYQPEAIQRYKEILTDSYRTATSIIS